MTPAEGEAIRELLEAERLRLESAIASLQENGRRTVDEDGDAGGVGADTAAITFEREFDERLGEGAAQTLTQIERALGRLAEGVYGVCERCGGEIGAERLRARPWATLCIDDQRLADRR